MHHPLTRLFVPGDEEVWLVFLFLFLFHFCFLCSSTELTMQPHNEGTHLLLFPLLQPSSSSAGTCQGQSWKQRSLPGPLRPVSSPPRRTSRHERSCSVARDLVTITHIHSSARADDRWKETKRESNKPWRAIGERHSEPHGTLTNTKASEAEPRVPSSLFNSSAWLTRALRCRSCEMSANSASNEGNGRNQPS